MLTIFLRTFIMYIILVFIMRLMGKRQTGELEISELAVTFMLSELAVLPISDKHIPLLHAFIPIVLLLSFEIILSFIISRCAGFKKLLIGKPSVIIRRGVLDQKALGSLRMSLSELMSEMRLKGISSISEIEYAIIEDNGQLSVFKKDAYSTPTKQDSEMKIKEKGISHSIIIEGKVHGDNLTISGKDEKWIQQQLKKRDLKIGDVFLMTVDDSGDIFIILKGKDK